MRRLILCGSFLLVNLAACGPDSADMEEARACSPAPLLVCPENMPPGVQPGAPGSGCWEVVLRCDPPPEPGHGG